MVPPQGSGGRRVGDLHVPSGTDDRGAVMNEDNNQAHDARYDHAWEQIRRSIADVDLNISFREMQPTVRPPGHLPRCFGGNRYAHHPPSPWVYKAEQQK